MNSPIRQVHEGAPVLPVALLLQVELQKLGDRRPVAAHLGADEGVAVAVHHVQRPLPHALVEGGITRARDAALDINATDVVLHIKRQDDRLGPFNATRARELPVHTVTESDPAP